MQFQISFFFQISFCNHFFFRHDINFHFIWVIYTQPQIEDVEDIQDITPSNKPVFDQNNPEHIKRFKELKEKNKGNEQRTVKALQLEFIFES